MNNTTWLNGKPFTVTQHQTKLNWGGHDMRCGLCGHKFIAGDSARWQFTNDTKGAGGNPFVCIKCDGTKEQIVTKIRELNALKKRMGWVDQT